MFSQLAEITDHLFLTSAAGIRADKLRELGVTCIVNATLDVPSLPAAPEVDQVRVRIDDLPHANLAMHLDKVADKIHQVQRAGGRTVVHCVAGVSRSSALCIGYMMKYQQMCLKDAFQHVKERRPVVRPNPGFFRQLIDYEKKLFGCNTVHMIESSLGQIPDIYEQQYRDLVMMKPSKPGGPIFRPF